MCDTIVVVRPAAEPGGSARVLFAKNSDRDANESQLLEWQPRRSHPDGAILRCTHIEIPQARETFATLISRPYWVWGAEIGTNEHGVVIGNEAVFTRAPVAEQGLTGMDLLRLALERADSAERAIEVMVELADAHGQGGRCGHEDRGFRYHSSFIVADPNGAFVVDSAGDAWAHEAVTGARSISNALSVEPFASTWSDPLKTRATSARSRQPFTAAAAARAKSPADLMAVLRHHGGDRSEPRYSRFNGGMGAPCMHAGGLVVNSQTTASWVSELGPHGVSHWATATAAPCTGLFKPVGVDEPVDLGPVPGERADAESLWWRHEVLHRRALRDPERLLPCFSAERDQLEAAWLAAPPSSAAAFAEGDTRLADWIERVGPPSGPERRPSHARRFWRNRNQRAGLESTL